METMNINEASAFLRMNPEVLRRWAKAGRVPASKIGKRWLFLRSDLIDFIRSKQQQPTKTVWPSIDEEKSGGFDLPPPAESEYSALLGLKAG